MKTKIILFSAAAVCMLASCSQKETVSVNNGRGIDFRVSLETKASETTTANISKFYVTAIDRNGANYFTDAEFVKEGSFFTSTPAYYWPGDGSALHFYAYSPSSEVLAGTLAHLGSSITINNDTKVLADFSPEPEISAQKDFITAEATGNKENESTGVALSFGHRLSQIEVKAKNSNTAYVYKIKGVRIGKPISKGTFNFADLGWTLGTDKSNYEVMYNTEKLLSSAACSVMSAEGDNAMLIPQQLTAWNPTADKTNAAAGAYIAVYVNITTKDGARVYPAASAGEYGWAAVAVGTNWKAGEKYVYTLDFSKGAGRVDPEKPTPVDPSDPFNPGDPILGGQIKFTVTVDQWRDAIQDVNM